MIRLVLGSSSPARLQTLRNAGLDPEVIVSEVDEEAIVAETTAEMVAERAQAKGEAVLAALGTQPQPRTVLLACDTMMEMGGHSYGKPGTRAAAIGRLRAMSHQEGVLFTGHYVAVLDDTELTWQLRTAATTIAFADLTDAEMNAYADSGEPEHVAGSFTIDGLGGPFITGIVGDPHNVVGISLPLVRQMLLDLGVGWPELWAAAGH